ALQGRAVSQRTMNPQLDPGSHSIRARPRGMMIGTSAASDHYRIDQSTFYRIQRRQFRTVGARHIDHDELFRWAEHRVERWCAGLDQNWCQRANTLALKRLQSEGLTGWRGALAGGSHTARGGRTG